MADPTADELHLLLELQATDHRVRRAQHTLDDLPEQQRLEEATARIGELELQQDDLRVELERATSEQRQLERELEILSERRDIEQARLYDGSVTNEREAKSVEAEVQSTVRRIDEHEEQLLEVLERVEELEARATELADEVEQQRARVSELEERRDEAAKGLLAELGELQVQRDNQASRISRELLQRYEEAAKRGGGTGVGKLEGNACTACRIEMSYADVGELYEGPPLTTCPQCRRLLVVTG